MQSVEQEFPSISTLEMVSMQNLITREEALRNEVFASFIATWQKSFDPREDPYMIIEGNYYDPELDQERFFTQVEIDEIHEKELAEYLKLKDNIEIKELEYFGELRYNLAFMDIFVYSIELGYTLQKLSSELNSDIIFILDYSVPWLYQKNDYQPVEDAMNYLRKIGVAEDFVGGFRFGGDALAEFVSHLFWIIRCNAGLPYCWFSTENHEFVGDLCKHGNIHIHCYSEKIKENFEHFASVNTLLEIEDCFEAFTDDGAIEGRQIIV
jgi:hypothetical protein